MNSFRVWRRLRRGQRGAELVEFAIVSIVFFMLMFGVIEFGRAIWLYGTVAHLAREGARFAIVRGAESGRAASQADVNTYVQTRAAGIPGLVVTTSWDGNSNEPGSVVQVRVERAYQTLTPVVPIGAMTLSSTSRMVISY